MFYFKQKNVNYSVNIIIISKTLNHLESTFQALKNQLFSNFPYFEGRKSLHNEKLEYFFQFNGTFLKVHTPPSPSIPVYHRLCKWLEIYTVLAIFTNILLNFVFHY